VTYQVYPRSFCDTSGDGIGDLEGIRRHLDHLTWLGVDAIWLSPFYPSPMADFGYDVSDYRNVDPLFGTLDDFDRLVAEAHRLELKVLVDWVPNHTSDQHPWFVASRSSRTSGADAKRDWYWWRDDRPDEAGGSGPPGSPGRLPNNWRAAFPGVGLTKLPPAWTWDEGTRQWYLHLFLAQQPDLNWMNPQVRSAMTDVLRFWLARGVDGFRIDVVHGLGKDPALPDCPRIAPGYRCRPSTTNLRRTRSSPRCAPNWITGLLRRPG
jgi:glycosidase